MYLTKENFWNEVELSCPQSFAKFKAWVDTYKDSVEWNKFIKPVPGYTGGAVGFRYYKLHDLPIEFQVGVVLRFADEMKLRFFLPVHFEYIPQGIKDWFHQFEHDLINGRKKGAH